MLVTNGYDVVDIRGDLEENNLDIVVVISCPPSESVSVSVSVVVVRELVIPADLKLLAELVNCVVLHEVLFEDNEVGLNKEVHVNDEFVVKVCILLEIPFV